MLFRSILDGVVEFEIVGVVGIAEFLGPRPGGEEHEPLAEALLHGGLQAAVQHVGQ